MESNKIMLIVVLVLLGVGFLAFIVHTIRCYLTKPQADDDEEYGVQFEKNERVRPI